MCENEASVVCYFRTTCYDKNHTKNYVFEIILKCFRKIYIK